MKNALKALFKILLNQRGEVSSGAEETVTEKGQDQDQGGSSPAGKGSGAASSGDGKNVTPAGQERSDFVPRKRFDEVYSRAKTADELEEALSEHKDKLYRDPVSGKLKLRIEATKPLAEEDDDEKDDLTEEERMVFDDLQWKALEKRLGRLARSTEKRTTKSVFSSYSNMVKDRGDREEFFAEAKAAFPDIVKEGSDFQREYLRILNEEFTQVLSNGQKYVHPKAIQDASIKAGWLLKKREESKSKELAESKKMNDQNGFVSKTSKSAPDKKGKVTDEEFALMSDEEQRTYMEDEFNNKKDAI